MIREPRFPYRRLLTHVDMLELPISSPNVREDTAMPEPATYIVVWTARAMLQYTTFAFGSLLKTL